MHAAGVIARDRRGRLALQEVDGPTLHLSQRPFSLDSPFRVASVSKMITAWGFMRLARARRLDLDGDVGAWLGAPLRHPAFPDVAITPRMLLAHTSGLRNGEDLPVAFGNGLMARLDAARAEPGYGGWFAAPTETPGRYFAYSDTNFAIIAMIMENVTGVRFDTYMRETLFAPLGLDIGYNWSGVSQAKRDAAAPGARRFDGPWVTQVDAEPPPAPDIALYRAPDAAVHPVEAYRLGDNGFAFAPHGGLRLSLRDMDALAQYFSRGGDNARLLRAMVAPTWTLNAAQSNGATEKGFYARYGLGVQRPGAGARDHFFGDRSSDWHGHCGDAYGWMTGLYWNARDGRTIVYAVNGMPETARPPAVRSALSAPEEALIDLGLAHAS